VLQLEVILGSCLTTPASTASTVSTATPGMHEAGAVPTRVLRNEATLPLMCAGGQE